MKWVFGFPMILLALLSSTRAQTVIEFWHSQNATEALIQTFADEFNASQTEYQVIQRLTGNYQESTIKLIAALGTDSAPVLFDAENTVFAKFLEEGSLADLEPFLAAVPAELLEDIYPVFWDYAETAEGHFGLPWNISVPVLYYNKSVLDQLGVAPPTSWEELETASDRLTTRSTRGYIDVAGAFIFETMVSTRGGRLVTAAGQPNFASPEAIEALSLMQRMAKNRTSIPRSFTELDQALVDFARTKGMMAIASQAFFPQGERFSVAFEVAAAPVPTGSSQAIPLVGAQMVVLKDATDAQKQGAIAFWQFLMEPENIKRWVEVSYFLPVRRSTVDLLTDWFAEDPSRRVGVDQLEYAIGERKPAAYAVWQSYLAEAIERATKAGMDPATVLEEAQQRALESP
jgi:sn-glycerol 3-phosphate transport system substrate-binding protein